jgi:hypothetical protein
MRWTPYLAAVAVVSFAFAETVVQEAVAPLSRPDSPPQPDAHGACDIRTGPDFERFRVVVEGVNAEGPLRVFLGDGHETLNQVGEMPAGSRVRTFLRTTLEGGELPYGVESVRALAERRIEVRDGDSRVVLRGNVPVFAAPPGGEEPPPPAAEPVVTRSTMRRTEEAGDREVRGTLVATRRADGSSLRLELGRFAPETGLLVYLWAENDLVLWDDVRTNREGAAVLAGDTAEGPGLPLHAESVVALAGRRVEVRDGEGRLYLYGEVPAAETEHDEEPVHEEATHEDEETGADVHVEADIRPERGREELTIVVRDIPREGGAAKRVARFVEVRMDDGTDTFEPVATVRVRGGRARLRYDSRRGDALPFGAESIRDLSGRAFRMYLGGTRVASGTLPQL